MEKSPDDFLPMLQEKLAAGAEWLKKNGVPALKDELRTFRALLGSIFDTLVKKGMLREDRYDYDRRPSDSAVPPDTYVPETAEAEVVGSRLNAYRRQLDFLLDGRSFELDALDPATLKNIVSLVAYIDWPHFGGATNSPTTNALSRFVALPGCVLRPLTAQKFAG